MRKLAASVILVLLAGATAAGARTPSQAPTLRNLSVANGGRPFAGDRRLLTTITPNGDGYRDRATIGFRLDRAARVRMTISRAKPDPRTVHRVTRRLGPGRHRFIWTPPRSIAARTYVTAFELVDARGRRRTYSASPAVNWTVSETAVVRVRGVDATFGRSSYRPGERATLSVATDAEQLTLQILRAGNAPIGSAELGAAVGDPVDLHWSARRDRAHRVSVDIGDWRSGVFFARLETGDGRVGYAPFIVRPERIGDHRVAVVLPTYTWQAYNLWDESGDGFGETWYAAWKHRTVRLGRPFLNGGTPPHFRRYDFPFLRWLHLHEQEVDYLAEADLTRTNGDSLARAYQLLVFPGHHEYVPAPMYDAVERFRDRGGNLLFLSANNFFWKVERRGSLLQRTAQWRHLRRPEASLIGVQYRGNDQGLKRRPYVVREARANAWVFADTGLSTGSTFGAFGIEIDGTAQSSPRGTQVLAEVPNLLGPGQTAQMTYYETARGAKVFAAGALDFTSAARTHPVKEILANLWRRLAS
jgi:phage-related protein